MSSKIQRWMQSWVCQYSWKLSMHVPKGFPATQRKDLQRYVIMNACFKSMQIISQTTFITQQTIPLKITLCLRDEYPSFDCPRAFLSFYVDVPNATVHRMPGSCVLRYKCCKSATERRLKLTKLC